MVKLLLGALPELAASKTLACSQLKLWSSVATAELTSRPAVAQQIARRTPTPGAATAAGSHMLPWYQQARVLRKLTISATGLTAFVCVLHADYGEKPHAFSWLQSYYRAEVVEPLQRQYARFTKKDD